MNRKNKVEPLSGGLVFWLLEKLRGRRRPEPRLALLERITLAPRQSLALVEAEGRKILVATSAEGGPAFYPLDDVNPSTAHAGIHGAAHAQIRTPVIRTSVQSQVQFRGQSRTQSSVAARASW